MNAQQLKNSVLQMAVQGKLVPQDPNAEPAKALLEKIKAEKAELIKQKKIKADKDPSTIFRGEDNLFYETVGTKTKCIQDEIPFDIPDSWEWVRLENICEYIQRGKSPKYSLIQKYPVIAQKCNQWTGFSIEKAQFIEPESIKSYSEERIIQDKDLLWNSTGLGTLGRIAIYYSKLNPYELAVADSHVTVIRPIKKFVLSEYCYSYFANPTVQNAIVGQSDGSTKQKELATSTIKSYLFPLPPLEEQKRIVEKVQSLQPLITQYAEADTALQNLEKSFPENLKKSLLQWAVQGKPVPQDPNDKPAKALLEKIKAEKAELIKQKKIKTDKNPSTIFRGEDNLFYETVGTETKCIQDEIPFDIPDSWEWVRLGEIVYNHGQKTPDTQFSYIDIGSIDNINQKLNEQENILLPEKAPSRARKIVNKGDILYATVRPYLHNMCIIDKDFTYEPIASTGFAVLTCYKNIYNKFLFYYLLSPTFDSYANHNENSKGVAYPAINDTKLYKGLIPLPPLEEQKRITQKLETLKTLCTELERE